MKPDTSLTGDIVRSLRCVLPLLRFGGLSQIERTIIPTVTIFMIDQARRPFSVEEEPNQHVRAVTNSINPNEPIAARFMETSGDFSSLSPRPEGDLPR